MEGLTMKYESQGAGNYLSIQLTDEISRFQIKMLEHNQAAGLLPVRVTMVNGIVKLNYDITSMKRLSDVFASNEMSGDRAKKLLRELLNTILSVEDYFLSFTRILLEMDYIYVDAKNKLCLVYIPYAEKEILSSDKIKDFYHKLLPSLEKYKNDFVDLSFYVSSPDFSIAGLRDVLGTDDNTKLPEPSGDVQKVEPVFPSYPEEPVNPAQRTEKITNPKIEGGNSSFSKLKVPVVVTKEEESQKEKKPGFLGGLFSGGSKKKEEEVREKKLEIQKLGKSKKEEPVLPVTSKETSEDEARVIGTQMISYGNEQATVMLETGDAALVYHGVRHALDNFPFKIGNGKVEGVNLILEGEHVSRNHASIQYENGCYYVKDENSKNHTYVNNRQIPPYTAIEIHFGDVLRFANEEVIFME